MINNHPDAKCQNALTHQHFKMLYMIEDPPHTDIPKPEASFMAKNAPAHLLYFCSQTFPLTQEMKSSKN